MTKARSSARDPQPGRVRSGNHLAGVLLLALGLLFTAPLATAQDARAASFAAFVDAFRDAFRRHDRDAAAALFWWRGVSEADRARIMALLDRDLALDLRGLRLLPPGGMPDRFVVDGVPVRKNLPVVARLLARFSAGDGPARYSLHELGLKDEVFYIVLMAPDHGI